MSLTIKKVAATLDDLSQRGSARKIVVEDRGPGVPDAQKELIFERFWRADGRRGPGSGIGLALVRRIAFLHGGDVRVEDRLGGGARFVVSFEPGARPA